MSPETSSSIFSEIPVLSKESSRHPIYLLQRLAPQISDGKIKSPTSSSCLRKSEVDAMEEEHEKPVGVLTKAARMRCPDSALSPPCWGMCHYDGVPLPGPIEQIGVKKSPPRWSGDVSAEFLFPYGFIESAGGEHGIRQHGPEMLVTSAASRPRSSDSPTACLRLWRWKSRAADSAAKSNRLPMLWKPCSNHSTRRRPNDQTA